MLMVCGSRATLLLSFSVKDSSEWSVKMSDNNLWTKFSYTVSDALQNTAQQGAFVSVYILIIEKINYKNNEISFAHFYIIPFLICTLTRFLQYVKWPLMLS